MVQYNFRHRIQGSVSVEYNYMRTFVLHIPDNFHYSILHWITHTNKQWYNGIIYVQFNELVK